VEELKKQLRIYFFLLLYEYNVSENKINAHKASHTPEIEEVSTAFYSAMFFLIQIMIFTQSFKLKEKGKEITEKLGKSSF